MEFQQTRIPDVILIKPDVYGDTRGFFKETYQRERYQAGGVAAEFVQDNFSRSCQHTLRGLHFQIEHTQGKLLQVMQGEIFDVAVDLRKNSETFGNWVGELLSADNHHQLYVPPGFAHGFCVLSESADVFYKCTDYYHPEHERTLIWNDADVSIDWPLSSEPILSEKDQLGTPLATIETF